MISGLSIFLRNILILWENVSKLGIEVAYLDSLMTYLEMVSHIVFFFDFFSSVASFRPTFKLFWTELVGLEVDLGLAAETLS
jgi:hypothetical protein